MDGGKRHFSRPAASHSQHSKQHQGTRRGCAHSRPILVHRRQETDIGVIIVRGGENER